MYQEDDWREQARCKGMDSNIFFPERGATRQVEEAKAICNECPVKHQCLEQALTDGEKIGVWGGTSERERVRIRRSRGISYSDTPRYYPRYEKPKELKQPRRPAECGTPAGYERHRKWHESPCIACKEANRLKTIHYRNLKKR